jgi:dipeptidyl-peptidase-4
MQIWGDELYPTLQSFKYPKAGENNSHVSVHLIDLQTGKDQTLFAVDGKEAYLPGVFWSADNDICSFYHTNRFQNTWDLYHYSVSAEKAAIVYREESDTYVERPEHFQYLEDGKTFLITSEKDGYRHLYHYNYQGDALQQITSGKWELTSVNQVVEAEEKVYFTSTQKDSKARHLYSIQFNGRKEKTIIDKKGTNDANVSPDGNFIVNTNSTIDVPPVTAIYDGKGKMERVLIDNQRVAKKIAGFELPRPAFFTVPAADKTDLNAFLVKPSDFDKSKSYPLLIFVYGGPGIQTVQDQYDPFNMMWFHMLAEQGYLVMSFDGRGTGGRGAAFKKQIYGKLGELEHQDLVAVAQHMGKKDYIDSDRLGVWGWSFGGYLTLLGLTKSPGVFAAGIAVAPVTHWKFYDTVYSERYLKTPQENAAGYNDNSPLSYADKLDSELMLCHGTADDNVHFQNSIVMLNAFISANKHIETYFYPDRNHGIFGGITRYHLYEEMTQFIKRKL